MYSSYVESRKETDKDIVPACFRLSAAEVSAYLLQNHMAEDIIDRENCMIDASRIDLVSEELNMSIEKLLELEMKNGLQ